MAIVGVVLAGALHPRQITRARLKYVATVVGIGVVSAIAVLAWPLYTLF